MTDNVISFVSRAPRIASGAADGTATDRNVVLVEGIMAYIQSNPHTSAESVDADAKMTVDDALVLKDLIEIALRICNRGPHEFEAWACKDLAHYEQWLRHYQKQVNGRLEAGQRQPDATV